MDLNNISFFKIANQEMQYLAERQNVLARNIANVNTPGYIAQDIQKPDFATELKSSVSMNVTNKKHMTSSQVSSSGGGIYTPKPDFALTIDGNGVDLEDQLNKVSKTRSDYNKVTTIYNNYKNMLKLARSKATG